jgi:NAD(P)-dependent dehydrogenase (short-subunit alcohol dehydrogenase family)
LKLDVTQEADAIAAMDRVMSEQGKLNILVNAAGIEIEKTVEDTTLEEWNQSFAVNSTGTFLTSKYALPLLRAATKSGTSASLINFGSYDGFIADPGLAAYCATKGAVHALTRAMACDHGPEGIRVNAICPGYIDTPMLQSFFEGDGSGGGGGNIETLQKAVRDVHPMRTYGTPEDIANLVNWLASDEARYASGQLWVLDGGLSAQVQQMKL